MNPLPFKDQILAVCNRRQNEWTDQLRWRAISCNNQVAYESRYHYKYNKTFTTDLQKGAKQPTRDGRPIVEDSFNLFSEWLEIEVDPIEWSKKMVALDSTDDI